MTIQFNTDKTIDWDQRHDDHFSELIKEDLDRFSDHISRIEVHISDENGAKEGKNDIRCLLEARLEGKQPIAVSNQSDSIEAAVSGALTKIKASLKTIIERSRN
jgi:hypothetical protein